MRVASIDLGTNTCLLLIADQDSRGSLTTVEDYSTVVRLGQGVDAARVLHPDAKARTLACLERYRERVFAAGLNPAQTIAVATSQARDARDGAEFFSEISKKTGFQFRTLSGDQEAKATFLGGLLPESVPSKSSVIDIGGGSTEWMSEQGGESLDIGAVRFTERYLKSNPVTDEEFWKAREATDLELKRLISMRSKLPADAEMIAVAGTAVTLAAWHLELNQFDRNRIDGLKLTRGDLHRMVEELKWRTVAERKALAGVEEGRADVLLSGALILWRACEILGFAGVTVSTRGLRYGVLRLS
jgi:exopolyphosphatase/guanosine-5'-triphosphate,3'-diphosphate pyrophosphatase